MPLKYLGLLIIRELLFDFRYLGILFKLGVTENKYEFRRFRYAWNIPELKL